MISLVNLETIIGALTKIAITSLPLISIIPALSKLKKVLETDLQRLSNFLISFISPAEIKRAATVDELVPLKVAFTKRIEMLLFELNSKVKELPIALTGFTVSENDKRTSPELMFNEKLRRAGGTKSP